MAERWSGGPTTVKSKAPEEKKKALDGEIKPQTRELGVPKTMLLHNVWSVPHSLSPLPPPVHMHTHHNPPKECLWIAF